MKENTKTQFIRLIIILIFGLIGFIYYMSEKRPFPYQDYDRVITDLQRIDAELNEAIVLTRFGIMKHYDPIVHALQAQEKLLSNIKIALQKNPNLQIQAHVNTLEKTLTQKMLLTEQFERMNPILINAISQFSTILSASIESESSEALIENFQEQVAQNEKNRQIEYANNLFRGILIYVSHRTEEKYQELLTLVEEIANAPQDVQLSKMNLVLNYARKILELQPKMSEIDAALFQIPVVSNLQSLRDAYDEDFQAFSDQGDYYRFILYFLIITSLVLLRWTFARLQNTVVVLHKEVEQRIEAQEALAETNRELENRVAQRTQELTIKNRDLNQAMGDLREAQDQLIIKEKMASVGMLTTGIAHEIKNPLNFVNNFSEISIDLVAELNQELETNKEKIGSDTLNYIQDIINDLKTNCTKIKEHGVRADNIVKMMLMHSQEAGIQKEMISIHNLIEDNIRIAIETFSAAHGKFEPTLEKQFDPAMGEILAAPQTLGRAFIYIFDNALYAMHEKQQKNAGNYIPTLSLKTQKINESIEFIIQDNGVGIPKQNVDKIFEPFFTTKPTGKGNTGLGLSICYDTVVKQHKGTLKAASEEGVGTTITITLPIKPITGQNKEM